MNHKFEVFDHLEEKLDEIRNSSFYEPYIQELKEAFQAYQGQEITPINYKTFMYFYTTGSRKEYEDIYFARRSRLGQALMLYLLYEEQVYLDEVCEAVWAICNEHTWVLPAHLKDVPVENYRTHIDLFAAETAHSLAEADYLLGDKLPFRIRELIRCEVKEKTFDAFESRTYFWEKLISNWPGVCASSVGMAYLLLAPERFEGVKDRILGVLQVFLKSYGDDGSNTEGISYWEYGFGMYSNFADMLYRYSEGKTDIRHGEKEDKIATFLQKIVMRKNIMVSFSDGSRTYGYRNIGLLGYLTKNYEGVVVQSAPPEELGFAGRVKPTVLVRTFLWSDPKCFSPDNEMIYGTEYMEDAKWYLVKKEKYSFAAKGGHNQEGHNHNDVGNFILTTDEGQMIADLGAMEYTADCFDGHKRYGLLQNSSLGHSVPIIDGMPQACGEASHAIVTGVSEDQFVVELQEAYHTDMKKIVRTYDMRESGITLTDTFADGENHKIAERFIAIVEPKLVGEVLHIGNVSLHTSGIPTIKKETLRNHRCIEEDVWLIDYEVDGATFTMSIEVEA